MPPVQPIRRTLLGAMLLAALPAHADLTALVAASRSSVLPVGTYNPLNSPRFSFRGSGFVVGGGNLVITNAHVLPESGTTPEPQLAVLVNARIDSAAFRLATVVNIDRAHDLALLKLEGPPLPALTLGAPDSVREDLERLLG